MAQQYGGDMYADYSQNQNRSPVSNRYGNGLTLNRQPSRQFEQYTPQPPQGIYQDDHSSQYDSASRFDRMPPSTIHSSNYPYENQTWNYGGANAGANMMGGTGRVKPQAPRRAGLPSVGGFLFTDEIVGALLIFSSGMARTSNAPNRTHEQLSDEQPVQHASASTATSFTSSERQR